MDSIAALLEQISGQMAQVDPDSKGFEQVKQLSNLAFFMSQIQKQGEKGLQHVFERKAIRSLV